MEKSPIANSSMSSQSHGGMVDEREDYGLRSSCDGDTAGNDQTNKSEDYNAGKETGKYTKAAMKGIAEENMQGLKLLIQKLKAWSVHGREGEDAGIFGELEDLFMKFSSQQISIAMQSLTLLQDPRRQSIDLAKCLSSSPSVTAASIDQGMGVPEDAHDQPNSKRDAVSNETEFQPSHSQTSEVEKEEKEENQEESEQENKSERNNEYRKFLPRPSMRTRDGNWSDSWKKAVQGDIQKHRRQRICDMTIPVSKQSASSRKVVPKSENAKERLKMILSKHFLLGDLADTLRDQLVDAFQDLRVDPDVEVVRAGESADFFYVIDVGEVDVFMKKGTESCMVQSKKGGESFGELALMYDTVRNVTVRTKTQSLLWSIDRPTFKSTINRHLSGSQTAQVLREAPALKGISTKDIVRMSQQCNIQRYVRGQQILGAGSTVDKVYLIQEGQVRMTCGMLMTTSPTSSEGKLPSSGAGWAGLGGAQPAAAGTGTGAGTGAGTGMSMGTGDNVVALMNRLEVLGEAMFLNDDTLNLCNYVASSDHVELIVMSRNLLDHDLLKSLRKGFQVQLISLALQRVPAFLELESEQLANLAASFTESFYKRGEEITKMGDPLSPDACLYVVQRGSILVYRTVVNIMSDKEVSSNVNSGRSSWGLRLGSFLKSSSTSSLPDPGHGGSGVVTVGGPTSVTTRSAIDINGEGSSTGDKSSETSTTSAVSVRIMTSSAIDPNLIKTQTQAGPSQSGSDKSKSSSSVSRQNWARILRTYDVFGEECLQDDHGVTVLTSQFTTIADSTPGVICLSVTRARMASILGPIHELLSRVLKLKILRKVPCLEYLTSSELDVLSHSMGVKKLKIGEVLYEHGQPIDRLYLVHKGTVSQILRSPKDGKIEEQFLGEGSYFGDEALLKPDSKSKGSCVGKDSTSSKPAKIELYYLDRAVLEANVGPLEELSKARRAQSQRSGLAKNIAFEDLEHIGLLGTGLFGKVKLVYGKQTKEFYALKCVRKAQVIKMQEEEHLRNEKTNMAAMDHPFITKLIRTFKDDKYIYLLQELTVGKELFQFMERVGPLQEWEAAFYAGGVLLALEYMHGKGIVYRDLKPENTLIGENGYPKLIDMGFAKRIYNRKTFSMCGTPDYMAPEIIKRQGHGKAVDFWALGCLIFEMITNTSPFNRGSDPPQVVFQNVTESKVRFPVYVSPTAVDIITNLLDPNPETRLGCRGRGIAELKEHPFFTKEIAFHLLLLQKEEAPMIPPKVTDYKTLCIPDPPNAKHNNQQYDDMSVVSQHDANWDDIF